MKKFIIFAGINTVILTGILTYLLVSEDKRGPVIEIIGQNVIYREAEPEQELLKAVTARDDRDGDVTDSIMIEDILLMLENTKAKVTFVAKDKSNNITKKNIVIPYEASIPKVETSPRLTLSAKYVVLGKGENFDPTAIVREATAEGVNKKELLHNLSVIGKYDSNVPGNYVMLLYITDSKGKESNKEYVWIEVK